MRNFKKFLALVLAMLMVSACAVSVSAYADQADIDATGYANAVAVLSDLGVIQGDGTNFNPNGTLTRAEAAVIAAKLAVGSKKVEWTSATSFFKDVAPSHWGNAYINYVAQRGIMDGVGDGTFNPDGTLTLAQALTIAVKAGGRQADVAALTANNKYAYWATPWMNIATVAGFDTDIDTWNYEIPCTRAMFAKIAYNIIINDSKIKAGFGFGEVNSVVDTVKDGVVTFENGAQITEAAVNAGLAAAGYDKTVAEIVGAKVAITYAGGVVYAISVDTAITTYTYVDAKVENKFNDADKKDLNAGKIIINGVEYVIVADVKADDTVDSTVIGGAATTTKYITVEWNGAETLTVKAIPTYYKAVAYDDDGNGDFERLFIDEYQIAKLVDGGTEDDPATTDTDAKVQVTKIDYVDAKIEDIAKIYSATFSGIATTYGEAPALVYVEGKNVDVLELSEKVTGVVSSIKADKYITIDKAYEYAAAYVAPASWVLGQNVTIYTINDKYVAVASADTGIESGMVEKTVLVDKVAIEDGKAVISGYYYGAAFEAVTLKVAGIENDVDRLVARNAYLNDKDNKIDYNKDNKVDDADKAFVAVALGTNKKDDGTIENALVLEDNTFYDVKITSAGAYIVGKSAKTVPATEKVDVAISISGSYIKRGDEAYYRLADSYVVVAEAPADTTKAYNYYSDTYVVSANGAIPANLGLNYAVRDKDMAVIDSRIEDKVALVYITKAVAAPEAEKTVAALAEGMTIVKITSEESASLDYNTYNAFNIFTGETVTVTGAATVGKYATVVDGKVVTDNTKWIGTHDITVTTVLGQVESVHAYNSYLKGEKDGAEARLTTAEAKDANKVVFGLDNVTIWKLDDKGNLVADTEFKYDDKTEIFGFINGGKVVILPKN